MACPNLLYLNLRRNVDCLKSLQGLGTISARCRDLQGLSLREIPDVECHVWMWEILVTLKLTYLAIELCVLVPLEKDTRTIKTAFSLVLEFESLRV